MAKTSKRIEFLQLLSELILRARGENISVAIFWLNRTTEQQKALYAIGRTIELHRKPVTNCDGVIKRSMHQEWLAGDLCVINPVTFEWIWERVPEYEILGRIALDLGLRWGGDWNGNEIRDPNDFDIYHFELGG